MVLRLEAPLAIEDLTGPMKMADSARRATRYPVRWQEPFVVLTSPSTMELRPSLRTVAVTLANAGCTPWTVTAIAQRPAWLRPPTEPLPWHLPGDGSLHSFHFPLNPDYVGTGESQTLTLTGGGRQVEYQLCLAIPDAPVPWPEVERIALDNPFAARRTTRTFSKTLTIRNLGQRAVACRAAGNLSGLHVEPAWLEISSGGKAVLKVTTYPNPALLTGADAAVVLTASGGETLCNLPVDVPPLDNEPIPLLGSPAELDLGSHPPGRRIMGHWLLENKGTAAAHLCMKMPPGASGPDTLEIKPGSRNRISIHFDTAALADGAAVAVTTNSSIPELQHFQLAVRFRTVTVTVDPPVLDFGTIPFGHTAYLTLHVQRSDGHPPRVEVSIPDDLAGLMSAKSGRVSFYNDKRSPEAIQGQSITLHETQLQTAITLPISASCLTPQLVAEPLRLTLVPGAVLRESLPLRTTGGRVSITRARILQPGLPWLRVGIKGQGDRVDAYIATRTTDRGTLRAEVELRTNIPRNQPVIAEIELELRPTWRMRITDAIAWLCRRIRMDKTKSRRSR